MRRLLTVLFIFWACAALAEEQAILGLSTSSVEITTDFTGSELLIFGAVARETQKPQGDLGVVITVTGPTTPVTVWRKARKWGIWVNHEYVEIDRAPQFYAIATSAPFEEIMSDTQDLRHKVSIERAIRSVGAPDNIKDSFEFTQALIDARARNALYALAQNTVDVQGDTLFQTMIQMPTTISEGPYNVRVYLTRDREVVGQANSVIDVKKVGFEEWLYAFAQRFPLLYGIFAVAVAVLVGWMAHGLTTVLRRS